MVDLNKPYHVTMNERNAVKAMSKEDLIYNLIDVYESYRITDFDDDLSVYRLYGALQYIFEERLKDVFTCD